jgi:agmatinase
MNVTEEFVHFHGDDVVAADPEKALFHVLSVPYEETVSYQGGTAAGPRAILQASAQLELFDGKSVPAEYGIYTAPPVDTTGKPEAVQAKIAAAVGKCLSLNKIPVILGGEHSITAGSVTALQNSYEKFGVIQFDAHADLRESYLGSKFSHACVMKRIYDRKVPFIQIGVRSLSWEEYLFRQEKNIPFRDAEEIVKNGVESFQLPAGFPEQVFITFDIDVFDPALVPATGTPVPGGITWYQAMGLIEKIMEQRICIGMDVVELAPVEGLHSPSFTAAQLVYNMMGYLTRSAVNRRYWSLA